MRSIPWLCVLAMGCGDTPASKPTVAQAAAVVLEAPDEVPQTAAPVPARKNGSDWPSFLGPTGDSVSTEKGILSPWPRDGLRVVWQLQTGTGYSVPSISKGRLFLFDRHGDKARLSCRNSETGAFLWKFEYPTEYQDYYGYNNGPRCCPVVDDDRVYTYGAEGMLHCVQATDGKLLWKADTVADFGMVQYFFGVGSAPVIDGDRLIVQVGGSPPDTRLAPRMRGNGTGVVAFDKRTGKVIYRVSDELSSYAVPVFATMLGRRWCFVLARGGLLGLEPNSGKQDFHFPWRARDFESVNASNPVVVGDQVFISETYGPGGAMLKVSVDKDKQGKYEVVWSDADKRADEKSMQCHWNTPIHHNGYLYGCSGRHPDNAELRCIEWATGKVIWSKPGLSRTSLLMVDGHFVCLGEYGQLSLLKVNPRQYEEVSTMDVRSLALKQGERRRRGPPDWWAAPVLSHGLLYVRGEDHLVCLELIPEKR